jgi:hypothetical protein
MTLTEFLLARIAEDEADPVLAHASWCHEVSCDCGLSRARVLAECAAKRDIIEEYVDCRDAPTRSGPAWELGLAVFNNVARRLAKVYADHPDYREEWRP